jgi:hypothetical protein
VGTPSVVTVQCFFSNTCGASVRIHLASAFGAVDVTVMDGEQVDIFLRPGPKVLSIFDLGDGSLIITVTINVPNSGQPTWTILSGGLLQFPDGHTQGGSSGGALRGAAQLVRFSYVEFTGVISKVRPPECSDRNHNDRWPGRTGCSSGPFFFLPPPASGITGWPTMLRCCEQIPVLNSRTTVVLPAGV